MMALAMGLMLFCATQGVARNLPQKEVMEKVQAIQAHLNQKNPEAKLLHFDSPTLPMKLSAPQNDEDLVTITCKMIWNEEEMPNMQPFQVVIQSTDWEYLTNDYCFWSPEVSFNVPKNKEYYVIGLFNDYFGWTTVVETVNITEDCTITIDADKADQEIFFKPVMQNGEPIVIDAINYDENYNPIVIDKGTINEARYNIYIQLKYGIDILSATSNYSRYLIEDGVIFNSMDYLSIKTNDNDCLNITNCFLGLSEEYGAIAIKLLADGNKSQVVSNSPNDYIEIHRLYGNSIWNSPTSNEYFPEINPSLNCGVGVFYNWTLSPVTLNYCMTAVTGEDIYPTDNFYMNSPAPEGNDYVEMLASPIKIFYNDIDEYLWQSFYGISSPLVTMIDGIPTNIASHNSILEMQIEGVAGWLRYQPDNCKTAYNPWFSFPLTEDQNEIYGGNVPITQFSTSYNNNLSYSFIGRYSESRSIDFMNHKVNLYHNENIIAESWKEIQSLPQKWWENPIDPGKFKVEIENANMTVDGIQGCNTFVMEYDNSVDNFSFPALEILQFRNTDNEVTDRFGNASEGILTFAAGSLIYTPDGYNAYYDYEPLKDIKVEYAPNGTESYKELMVEEDPEKFYMPGYGAYYYASLDQVDNMSENGWFDVCITLIGSNGAYQQQTISPAFKVDKNTGIPSISNVGNMLSEVRVNGHNIIAPSDAVIISSAGIVSSGQNVAPGIYIVRLSNGSTQKVIVK